MTVLLRCVGCGRDKGKYRTGGLRGEIWCDDCYDGSLLHAGLGVRKAARRLLRR